MLHQFARDPNYDEHFFMDNWIYNTYPKLPLVPIFKTASYLCGPTSGEFNYRPVLVSVDTMDFTSHVATDSTNSTITLDDGVG